MTPTVDHYLIQTESSQAVHVGDIRIRQAAGARLRLTTVTVGGDIARHAITVDLAGDRCAGRPCRCRRDDPATAPRHRRHRRPRRAAVFEQRNASRAVVDDHARSSFSGEIIVRPGAAATDAHQSSRNLVLSPNAEADTRPWLQILADDVRCTHGATVGRLDDEALFYLRSRGIPTERRRARC